MAYTVTFTKHAAKQVQVLDTVARRQIAKKLQRLAMYEDIHTVAVALAGELAGQHRIRIGAYRVICVIEGEVITVLRVEHRQQLYR